MIVADTRQGPGERGQLVVVGGEEHLGAAASLVELLRHGPRDGEPIEGGGAAPDLVEEDQAALRGVVEDARRLYHLHEEGALAARQIVLRAHTGEDAVDHPDAGGARG